MPIDKSITGDFRVPFTTLWRYQSDRGSPSLLTALIRNLLSLLINMSSTRDIFLDHHR